MLPTIQSLWIGEPLSNMEKLCVQSYLDNGHEFHLYVYDNVEGIPSGAVVKDGNEILPESEIFYTNRNRIETFSDWFRWALLAKRGGFWVDMDTVCIRPFNFSEEIVFGYDETLLVSVAFVKFPKDHFFPIAMEKFCRHHTTERPWDDDIEKSAKKGFQLRGKSKSGLRYPTLGNSMFNGAVNYYHLQEYGKPFFVFFPCGSWDPICFFDDVVLDEIFADVIQELYPQTHGIHIANDPSRGISENAKNATFPANSIIEQLKRKHGVTAHATAPTISREQVRSSAWEYYLRRERKKHKTITDRRRKRWIFAVAGLVAGALIGLLL